MIRQFFAEPPVVFYDDIFTFCEYEIFDYDFIFSWIYLIAHKKWTCRELNTGLLGFWRCHNGVKVKQLSRVQTRYSAIRLQALTLFEPDLVFKFLFLEFILIL